MLTVVILIQFTSTTYSYVNYCIHVVRTRALTLFGTSALLSNNNVAIIYVVALVCTVHLAIRPIDIQERGTGPVVVGWFKLMTWCIGFACASYAVKALFIFILLTNFPLFLEYLASATCILFVVILRNSPQVDIHTYCCTCTLCSTLLYLLNT